ncbi:MAG: hypothetical protein AAFR61_18810 [Bacteroidota bacterium]
MQSAAADTIGIPVTLASSRANSSGGPGNHSLQLRATYQRSWTIS